MKTFVRVAETASFTLAAQQMDVTTAQASRAVSELEVHLRTRLFNRTTRRVALTDTGARYLARCKEILRLIDASEAEAGEAKDEPVGVLRMHARLSFGQIYVMPALTEYLAANPQVRIELSLSQRIPDILDEGSDRHFEISVGQVAGQFGRCTRRGGARRNRHCSAAAADGMTDAHARRTGSSTA